MQEAWNDCKYFVYTFYASLLYKQIILINALKITHFVSIINKNDKKAIDRLGENI